ncbi:MAG: GNAT family N-acetyltransferase [Gemella haemolysans]|uniref:GNAT family N-acetyltransferase n=1 Tax=Gemella haemolysans TaxID=1379 RepID=UPI00290EAE68|nr:GNAT family N-acetyltransferase [Gemella haemolysans]MDU6573019.1 GNAT family N-acetyltransferase [Gemella haemolysans]
MIKILKSKEELNLGFALRIKVFVEEQNVPMELELDEKDNSENTVHIGFFDNNKLIGAARLIDLDKDVIHIGRVVIDKEYRGQGIGRELIIGCENIAQQILKRKIIIELSAQIQAENFYKSLGYNRVNDIIYLDAGIEHVDMRKKI